MSNGNGDLSGMPSPQEVIEDLKNRIVPRMQEAGIEAFVMVGYAKFDGESLKRFVFVNDGKNPAYADGLQPVIRVGAIWGQDSLDLPPPPGGIPE